MLEILKLFDYSQCVNDSEEDGNSSNERPKQWSLGEMDTAQKALIVRTVAETYRRTEAERCLGA